ncbi:DMT family transporter [Bacillus inaquosorum]|uniref:DMT family transporter n=1 Tax=Bacillus inaquosorum TaxID=483913 RepID=UPI002282096A|nr:DMT family transporter [Bacillus inaquosorum]MCY9384284.1 DMT family transporter [Bacillus inaquosorum]MEC0535392.1 DMT family transporter [Bacillus inaquosorum]
MFKKQQASAYMAAILYSFIIGLSFLFVKIALQTAEPFDILAHRFTIAFVTATVPVLFGWVKLSIRVKDVIAILPLALLYPALFFSFQAFGLVYSSSSEAGIIQAAIPIFTMVFASYVLKERSTWMQKGFTVLSVAGVMFIFVMKGVDVESASLKGSLLILLSALSSAMYNTAARKMTQRFKLTELTYIMSAIGFVAFNAIALVRHGAAGTAGTYFQPFREPGFVLAIVYLGVLSSLVTSFLSNYTLSRIEAFKMSAFNHVSTIVTMIAGVVILDESLAWYHLAGAVCIIIGVLGSNINLQKKKKHQKGTISMNK